MMEYVEISVVLDFLKVREAVFLQLIKDNFKGLILLKEENGIKYIEKFTAKLFIEEFQKKEYILVPFNKILSESNKNISFTYNNVVYYLFKNDKLISIGSTISKDKLQFSELNFDKITTIEILEKTECMIYELLYKNRDIAKI